MCRKVVGVGQSLTAWTLVGSMAIWFSEMTCPRNSTLVQSCEVVVGAKNVKHECKVLGMLGRIFGENEDVIEEDNNKIIQVRTEDVVHCTLEGGRCVGESEWHDFELVVAISGSECCFWDVLLGNADLPVS